MNKRFILPVVLAIGTAAAILYAAAGGGTGLFYRWGALKAEESPKPEESEIALQGVHFSITRAEIDAAAAEYALFGMDNPEERAVTGLIEKKSLYTAAVSEGFSVTEEEVTEYIEQNIEAAAKAENLEEYQAFLKGLDMTSEEYWNSLRPELEMELVTHKHEAKEYEEFLAKYGENQPDRETLKKEWDTWFAAWKDNIVAAEKVADLRGE